MVYINNFLDMCYNMLFLPSVSHWPPYYASTSLTGSLKSQIGLSVLKHEVPPRGDKLA